MADNRPFWKKPQGVTAAAFLVALTAGLLYLGATVLPSIEVVLQSNLYLGFAVAIISMVVFVAVDANARNIIRNAYMSVMRSITGVFIRMDPVSRLKGYLDGLAENIDELSIQIGKLRGEMRNLQTIINKNKADINKHLLLAEKARADNRQKELVLSSRKAGRLQDSNKKYDRLDKQMKHLYKILTRMYENSELIHEDTQDQIAIKEIEYKAILASNKAMKGAKNVIGGSSKKDLFDQSMQHILEDISLKTGEMERFMDLSKNYMDTMDVQSATFESDGLALLEQFDSSILADSETLDLNKKSTREREKPRPEEEDNDNEYEGLF